MTRLSTGVPGLDDMISGGYLQGDSVLVAGSPGCGKTTMGLHFIAAGVAAGEPGIYVSFEYLPQQLYRDAAAHGWDLKAWEDTGMAQVICTTPDMLLGDSAAGESLLEEAIQAIGAKRLVIDSMTFFEFIGRDDKDLRSDLSGLMNRLRLMDITTLVVHEIPQIIGPAVKISKWGLEFLVDAVILLRYVELEGELRKAINVLKFRGGDHDKRYRPLVLDQKGAHIEGAFDGVENISAGSARRSVQQRAKGLV